MTTASWAPVIAKGVGAAVKAGVSLLQSSAKIGPAAVAAAVDSSCACGERLHL